MTDRLLAFARDNWADVDGWQAAEGNPDPMTLPIDRFLNVVYWFLIKDGDAEEVERFKIRLWRPPPKVVPTRGPWTAAAESAAFASFAAQVNGTVEVKGNAKVQE